MKTATERDHEAKKRQKRTKRSTSFRRSEKRSTNLRRSEKDRSPIAAGTSIEASTKESGDSVINILQLPEMVLLDIFSYLPVKDKCRSTRVCKTFRRVMKDSQLWKHVDLTPYTIRLQNLTKVTRRYLSKSLKHLELKGFLWTTVKTNLLSEVYLEELRGRCPNLSKLVIYNAELRHILSSKLPSSLQQLRIDTCQFKEGWLLPAIEEGNLTNLKSLDLSGCGRITNRDVSSMATLKKLEELILLGCYRLSDQAIETISVDHPSLKSLLIGHSNFTDEGIQNISQNMKKLRIFSIQNCEFVTINGLKYIERMKTIEELDISYNHQFDVHSIYTLVKCLPKLRKITVPDVISVRDTILQINPSIVVF